MKLDQSLGITEPSFRPLVKSFRIRENDPIKPFNFNINQTTFLINLIHPESKQSYKAICLVMVPIFVPFDNDSVQPIWKLRSHIFVDPSFFGLERLAFNFSQRCYCRVKSIVKN